MAKGPRRMNLSDQDFSGPSIVERVRSDLDEAMTRYLRVSKRLEKSDPKVIRCRAHVRGIATAYVRMVSPYTMEDDEREEVIKKQESKSLKRVKKHQALP